MCSETKAMISFAVSSKLVCAFVFAYVNYWFSHAVAHFLFHQIYLISVDRKELIIFSWPIYAFVGCILVIHVYLLRLSVYGIEKSL